jgi:hypothetical protein
MIDSQQQWALLKPQLLDLAKRYGLNLFLYRIDPSMLDWVFILTDDSSFDSTFTERVNNFRLEMHCISAFSPFHEISFSRPDTLFLRLADPEHLG